ncbi:L-fucose:H+ symporter permease, partial [Brevundimonas sp.]|uniref:L-fucose:H+ symporter permease n=1 Tax=Brevundimonas sp. TaxID=1871086 RepID=UPI0037843B7A
QSAFYLGYFFLALPAGLVMRRYGYKAAVVTGLLLFGGGALLFYPAAEVRAYPLFLAALFIIASGLAFLETSANPLITVLGDPAGAEQRLNLAQAFNPLGALTAVVVGRQFILSGVEPSAAEFAAMTPAQLAAFQSTEAQSTQIPYLIIAAVVFVWVALVLFTRFPKAADRPAPDHSDFELSARQAIAGLFARPRFLFGVAAQFFYVGAQVGVWSFMIRYAQAQLPGLGEKDAASWLFWSLVGFMVGRFSGTALMSRVRPNVLMAMFAAINVALVGIAVGVGGVAGLTALAATSAFMSIMFPTIFATSLKGLGPLTKTGSSFLVMSIVGGAVLTAIMGGLSDLGGIRLAMVVPGVCFAIVLAFAMTARSGATGAPEGAR